MKGIPVTTIPIPTRPAEHETPARTPTERLQTTMAAARVGFTWFGVRRTLSMAQKAQAAETFGAEGPYLSAAKKILDTRCPAYRAVTGVRNRVLAYWRGISLPYPESGLRLIRQDRIEPFAREMADFRGELQEAVDALDEDLPRLKTAARRRLGELYDGTDYPSSLRGLFAVEWDFPSLQPPDYLLQLKPELYEQERRRIVARFDEAVQLAEQAFCGEFSKLIGHLVERLHGTGDEKPKIFRDSAVGNLREFFARFRDLNVRSNEQLDDLVATAQDALRGVRPQDLRDDGGLRDRIAGQLAAVGSQLDGLMVDRPRRRILRRDRQAAG